MQAKWDEMFGEKKEEVVEEVKVKKPRKKAVTKKTVQKEVKSTQPNTKSKAKKSSVRKVAEKSSTEK